MHIEMIVNHGLLEREVWTFYLIDMKYIRLVSYLRQDKPTTRHKIWHTQTQWASTGSSYDWRKNTLHEQPPITPDMLNMVKDKICQHVRELQLNN